MADKIGSDVEPVDLLCSQCGDAKFFYDGDRGDGLCEHCQFPSRRDSGRFSSILLNLALKKKYPGHQWENGSWDKIVGRLGAYFGNKLSEPELAVCLKKFLYGRLAQTSAPGTSLDLNQVHILKIENVVQIVETELSTAVDNVWMNHVDLAQRFGLATEATRKRLDRWRLANSDGWREITEPTRHEPRYLYKLPLVRSILVDKASA